MAARLPPLIHN